jgi:hypothetical protein
MSIRSSLRVSRSGSTAFWCRFPLGAIELVPGRRRNMARPSLPLTTSQTIFTIPTILSDFMSTYRT